MIDKKGSMHDIDIMEDREGQALFPVRCRGCGQNMAWGTDPLPGISLYCSAVCAWDGPLGPVERRNERRNEHIRSVVAAGWTATKAAMYFGISRQRVNQMLYTTVPRPRRPVDVEMKKTVAYNRRVAQKARKAG